MDREPISIVIPSWQGETLLRRFLGSVVSTSQAYEGDTELIVVDDASTDGTRAFLEEHYPVVRVVPLSSNQGFQRACNAGVQACRYRLVLLLNNDIEVQNGFLSPLPRHFGDPDVFGVRIRSLLVEGEKALPDERSVPVRITGKFWRGFLSCEAEPLSDSWRNSSQIPSFSFGGGAVIFDREKFLELGGFDEILRPIYWEDIDLSYRVWKRGWKIVTEIECFVTHYHRSTMSKALNPFSLLILGERNRYLLVWKNISDPSLLLQHFCYIPLRLLRSIFLWRWSSPLAFFMALRRLGEVFKKRRFQKALYYLSDREVLQKFAR